MDSEVSSSGVVKKSSLGNNVWLLDSIILRTDLTGCRQAYIILSSRKKNERNDYGAI